MPKRFFLHRCGLDYVENWQMWFIRLARHTCAARDVVDSEENKRLKMKASSSLPPRTRAEADNSN